MSEYKEEEGEVFHSERELTPQLIGSVDLVMITTAHTNVDYEMVAEYAKAIFDTKNAMKNVKNRSNIEVL